MVKKYFLLIFFHFNCCHCFAQQNGFFQIINGSNGRSLICSQDSGYIFNSYIQYFNGLDFAITKTDKNGLQEWDYINNQFDGDDSSNVLSKILECSDKSIIGAGNIETNAFPSNYNTLFVRLDSTGNLLWRKQFDFGYFDGLEDLVEINDTTFISSGLSLDASGRFNTVIKFNIHGDSIWTKRIPATPNFGAITNIIPSGEEFYLLCIGDTFPVFKRRIAKMDSIGNLLWINNSPDTNFYVTVKKGDFRMTKDSFLLAYNVMTNQPIVTKYDLQGNFLTNYSVGFDVSSFGSDSTVLGSVSFNGNDTAYFGSENFYTFTTKLYQSPSMNNNIEYSEFVQDKDKNIVTCGRFEDTFNGFLAFASKGVDLSTIGLNPINLSRGSVHLFPIPATDMLNIFVDREFLKMIKYYTLSLYNSLGETKYMQENISNQNHQIDIRQFAKGIYYYKFSDNEKHISSGKFVIN